MTYTKFEGVLIMHQAIIIISFLTFILPQYTAFAQENTPDWWQRPINVEKFVLPEDSHAQGKYLVQSLRQAGLPIHHVCARAVKNVDIVYGNKTMPDGTTIQGWFPIPRANAWKPFERNSVEIPRIADVVQHYISEAGDYRLIFVKSQPVLVAETEISLCEKTHFEPLDKKSVSIPDLAMAYSTVLKGAGYGFSYGPGSSIDVQFDFSFAGGDLIEFLCEIAESLDSVYPDRLYVWEIEGIKDSHMLIGFGWRSREKLSELFLK